jgi:hypothetical protein
VKALIVALAVTAILAPSAVAKTHQSKVVRSQPSHSASQDAAVVQHNDSFCRFHYAQTEPDPIVRNAILRDCRNYESGAGAN